MKTGKNEPRSLHQCKDVPKDTLLSVKGKCPRRKGEKSELSAPDIAELSWRSSPRHRLTHPPMEQGKHHAGEEFHLFCPLLRPQHSELCLGQSRGSEIFVDETGHLPRTRHYLKFFP